MASVEFQSARRTYYGGVNLVEALRLDIADGELLSPPMPSGSVALLLSKRGAARADSSRTGPTGETEVNPLLRLTHLRLSLWCKLVPSLAFLLCTVGADAAGASSATLVADGFAAELATESAAARTFELARLTTPLCGPNIRWSFGPAPLYVPPQKPETDSWEEALRSQALAQFGAEPDEYVFVSVPGGTPWAKAGMQVGDRLPAALQNETVNRALEVQRSLPRPRAGQPHGDVLKLSDRDAVIKAGRTESAAQLSERPKQNVKVRRGDAIVQLEVEAEPVCDIYFSAIASPYPYAGSSDRTILATQAMLARVSDPEMTALLAHEVGHILAGTTDSTRVAGNVFAWLLLGKLIEPLQNRELLVAAPEPTVLIEADRTALWLLGAYRYSPAEYLALMQRLDEHSDWTGNPTYGRTRPMSRQREQALEKSIASWNQEKKLWFNRTVTRENTEALRTQSRNLRGRGQLTLPQTALQHARTAPPPSGFAALGDLDAVPVRGDGRARYAHYRTLPVPKAFAVTETGGWWFWSDDPDAMEKALRRCRQDGKRCWLYAVDNSVVWRSEPEQRIAHEDQLPPAK